MLWSVYNIYSLRSLTNCLNIINMSLEIDIPEDILPTEEIPKKKPSYHNPEADTERGITTIDEGDNNDGSEDDSGLISI